MLFDIGGDRALLPSGKATASRQLLGADTLGKTHQFVNEHGAQGLEVAQIVGEAAFDRSCQLDRGFAQSGIFEEHSRQERRRLAGLRSRRNARGIDIDEDHARHDTGVMPFAVFMTSGHEGQLVPEVPKRRSRQALDESLTVAARALLA